MITFPELPGVDINILLLLFVGFGAGILSGFAGVGGAFIATPILIILGFPANFAVGTGLAWVVGNSVIAAIRHRRLGNVDMKLGFVLLVAAMGGMEVGVRILNWIKNADLADETVLSISICVLLVVGLYTMVESIRRKRQLDRMLGEEQELPLVTRLSTLSQKLQRIHIPPRMHFTASDITVSLWIILAIGFFIGVLGGVMGIGGGFVMMPSLVYIIGVSSFMAVGTGLFQVIFAAAYGCIRHTMSGNVIIFAAFIMVIASSIGVQFGALVTRYVRGVSVRIVLGITILIFSVGTILKLLGILLNETSALFDVASVTVTFCGLGLTLIMILGLFIASFRYHRGRQIPAWVKSLISKTT